MSVCEPIKFSVVIPNYNRQEMVCDAVDSVLNQTYPAFEIIVIDDGSRDASVSQLQQRYGQKINLIAQANAGVATARNAGVEAATGDYICYLDSDDLWQSDKLALFAQCITKNPDAGLVFHDFAKHDVRNCDKPYELTNTDMFPYIFDYATQVGETNVWCLDGTKLVELLLRGYPFYPSAFAIKASLHHQYRWDPGVLKSEDFNFVLKISLKYPFFYIHKNLATVRVHGDNKSNDYITKNRIVLQTKILVRDLYKHGLSKSTFNNYIYPEYFTTGIDYIKKKHFLLGLEYVGIGLSNSSTYYKLLSKFKRLLPSGKPQ